MFYIASVQDHYIHVAAAPSCSTALCVVRTLWAPAERRIGMIKCTRDGQFIVGTVGDGIVVVWSIATGAIVGRLEGCASMVSCMVDADGQIRVVQPYSSSDMLTLRHVAKSGDVPTAVSNDGRLQVSGSGRVLRAQDKAPLASLLCTEGSIISLDFSHDKRRMVVCSVGSRNSDATVHNVERVVRDMYRPTIGNMDCVTRRSWALASGTHLSCAGFSSDDKHIFVGDRGSMSVLLLDSATGTIAARYSAPPCLIGSTMVALPCDEGSLARRECNAVVACMTALGDRGSLIAMLLRCFVLPDVLYAGACEETRRMKKLP